MRLIALGLLLAIATATAQDALWIDLSGEWRTITGRDEPRFATPDFDDRDWRTITLPSGDARVLRQDGWLRRRVDLPPGTDRTRLALTLGTLQDIGGLFIGATDNAQGPRPRTFPIPAAAARGNEPCKSPFAVDIPCSCTRTGGCRIRGSTNTASLPADAPSPGDWKVRNSGAGEGLACLPSNAGRPLRS